ncbi:hypothetical protein H5410_059964 [Solanum commersonii]|uniref:F-box protein n=1 Tax=Solanum commersonii TaxID=4109 RepID=A0A9J5W534_SOLCO|nr:hypothetical protein H5410_059964 [Solanum commersonii]
MKIDASSREGILCCMRPTRNNNYRYYICKPSAQEWKVLPNPKLRYWTVKVALIVNQIPYVSRFFVCQKTHQRVSVSLPEDVSLKHHHKPINASGLIYLLTTDDQVLVVNYDGEEAYPRFYLPEQVSQNKNYKNKKLISYEGKYLFVCLQDQEVETENIKRVTNYPSPIVMEGSNGSVFYKQQNESLHLVNSHKLYCPIEVFSFCSDVQSIN